MKRGSKTKVRYPGGMRDPILASYIAEIVKIPPLTIEVERDLMRKVKDGNEQARNSLVSSHLKFVVAVCWNYRHRGLPLPDLINEGNLALFNAAAHFDPSSPVRFMSYAVWWIRQGALDALARQAGSISFPPDRMHKAIRYRRAEAKLAQKLGRHPTPEEIAPLTGASVRTAESLRAVLEAMASTRGYGPPIAGTLDETAKDANHPCADAAAERYLLRKTMGSLLARLRPNEQRILSLRFGLAFGARKSLAEVSAVLGITCERVRQLEERALANLRNIVHAVGFL